MKIRIPSSPSSIRLRPSSIRTFSTSLPKRNTPSSPSPPSPPPPSLPPVAGISKLTPTRHLILLQGPDVPKFLQGVTTINVPSLTANKGAYSAFLTAQGRVLYDVFLYPATHSPHITSASATSSPTSTASSTPDPAIIIESDASSVDSLITHIKRYKLRSKFTIRPLSPGEFDVWATWNTLSPLPPVMRGHEIGCVDPRAPKLGRRLVMANGARPELLHTPAGGVEEVDAETYRLRRYLNGIPEGQAEIVGGQALPQESCMDYMGGIDFHKGCYVGQELTIRTHHTGVVRKRILPVQLYNPSTDGKPSALTYDPTLQLPDLPAGANISRTNRKGRSAGKFLTRVGNVGLGLCRLEIMTDIKLSDGSEGGYTEEDEFRVERGEEAGDGAEEVRIKAFVPTWHMLGNPTAGGGGRAPVSNTPLSVGH